MKKSLFVFLSIYYLILGGVTHSFAQKFQPKYLRDDDKAFLALTTTTSSNGWIEFRQGKDTEAINPDGFFDRFGKNIGLSEGYQMRLIKDKDETDFRQIRHQRFQLFYKGVRVEGVEFTLHSRTNRLESAHGRVVENLALDVAKVSTERQALEQALSDQKLSTDAFKGQELPKAELLIAQIGEEVISQNFRLCYVFDVRTDILTTRKEGHTEPQRVYVDAQSGQIVRRDPLFHKCFHVPAYTSKTLANTTQLVNQKSESMLNNAPLVASNFVPRWTRYQQVSNNFETELSGNQYRLSHQNGALVTRRDVNSNGQWAANPDVLNGSPNWGTNAQNATTAHWLTQRVHQFYQQFAPDQNGYNRQGTYPRILVDYNVAGDQVNAFWNRTDQLTFGFAPTNQSNNAPDFSRSLLTADVLGHEYTHAVTQNNANLTYQGESGSLNESISDIFGTAFERYLFPNDWNWGVGEDSYQLRSMSNPTQAFPPFAPLNGQPQIYQGPNWQPTTNPFDNGGVHINSGVMNKWFHTLCTGQGPQYNLPFNSPINFDDAIKIVYRALRYYLQSNSNYYDAANATRLAARDLYGGCSPQQRTVIAAWTAVGVGSSTSCDADCDFTVSLSGPSNVVCNQAITLTANCNGANTVACNNTAFSFTGPNIGYNMGGGSINITAPANSGSYQYTVTLNKSGCFVPTSNFTVNTNCSSQNPCDFSNGPRYVGTWNGLIVQIRSISGKNVLVTAIPNSSTDKYYPRGDNFWGGFNLDPGAAGLQSCLNAGSSSYGGLVIPSGLTPPPGYYQGAEQDGAVFFAQNGSNPPNPCDASPRHVGTWNGLNVEIRTFPNGKHALVTAVVGSSNDKYYVRGDNFWDNFTKDGGVDQYRACLNAGDTDWWGMAFPGGIAPPSGYQQGTSSDGAVYFSTNGLRAAAPEPILEEVTLVKVHPNPVQDEVTVTFVLKEAGSVQLRILDLQGRIQQLRYEKGLAGKNERTLSVGSLSTGLYALEVTFEGQRVIHKLVKQ